tara:strand:+ start:1529 stop:1960 length:432 start_codon:yes stop_codon:yes gene_type:complete
MTKPVEFGSFYKLLRGVIDGNESNKKELQWLLAEYEHAKDANSAFDELGQIFCHHGVMELYEYTGTDNLKYISELETSVWKYLKIRMGISLSDFMVISMKRHANDHKLAGKVSSKWNTPVEEINDNLEDLAKYVSEGIIELIK